MLKIESLSKSFAQPDGDVRVLVNADWELGPRQTAALLGESGSGKSTLLNLVAGLDVPDSGEIYLDGERTSGFTESRWNVFRRNDLGLVFQHYHLVPTLPVDDNIHLQARLAGRVDSAFSRQLIEHLGLGALLKRLPHQLSGGQQQRVAIARSLMHRPRLVLADEPTGNLDEHTSVMVMKLFTELIRESDSSLLMVTHSETMAAFLDSRWRLHNGEILAES